ncbi:hypothetical protein [Novispirillum itersonii]|uniref:hypothetical protein n=1 Tax=Novispirillum itersonii TaxID=189 RepID=UPI00037730F4|nr:hypothetical protein [Novispirillum itersonii]
MARPPARPSAGGPVSRRAHQLPPPQPGRQPGRSARVDLEDDDDIGTPEEKAEVIVLKLERFIRDNRTLAKGVSFRKWQELARLEIASAIRSKEVLRDLESRALDRAMIVLGVGLATVGVWGSLLAVDAGPSRIIAGTLTFIGGMMTLWVAGALGLKSPLKRFQSNRRRSHMKKVRALHAEVLALESYLKKRKKQLEEEIEDLGEDA